MIYSFLIIIQYLSIALLAIECFYTASHITARRQAYLFAYLLAIFVNNIGYLLEMMADNSEMALMGTKTAYMGKVFIPFMLFILVMNICYPKSKKTVFRILFFVHVTVLILVLSNEKHHLFYSSITYTETGLFPHNVYGHGPVYMIFMVMMFVYLIVGLTSLIVHVRREKSADMKTVTLFFIASSFIIGLGFAIFLTGITGGYDLTALSYACSTVLTLVALTKYDLLSCFDAVKNHVLGNLQDGILAVDRSREIFFSNAAARKIFPDIFENGKQIIEEIEEAVSNSKEIYRNGRSYLPIRQPLIEKNSERGVIYDLTDITELNQIMEQLREQKIIAENANNSKSAFLSVVSHEIRTPMNAVVGMTEILLRDKEELNEKQLRYLNNIRTSGEALVMIVNDILDQSKIEAGKMEIVEQPYELLPVVEDVRMIIENRVGDKPVRIITELDESVPNKLVGDGLRIRQIIINLMNNAVKFTDEGFVKLSISTVSREGDSLSLRFSISDSGQGIKPEDIEKLGKAFSQVDVVKNHRKEGTGLGLSISKNFISLMGGELKVKSEYGKGSEFYFTISQKAVSEELSTSREETEEIPDFTGLRILIVDDTELNRLVLEELLSEFNVSCTSAESASKALSLLENETFDIICTDYIMPGMDGLEMTKKIRETGEKTPIIVMSGDTSEDTMKLFTDAGADGFVQKPVSLPALKETLKIISSKQH